MAEDVNFEELVDLTDGWSGAEIVGFCREAAISSLRENINNSLINRLHFLNAYEFMKKSRFS